MAKVAVVYWSGSGNTEAMANAVVEGAKEKGADVSLFFCSDFNEGMVGDYDARIPLPAMGAEVLEEAEFEPMFTACGPEARRQEHCTVWLLRLGHRRVDALLGRPVRRFRRSTGS